MALDAQVIDDYKATLFPYASEATDRVVANGCRFAYYTTAATAVQILRNRQIWMRSTKVMNDVREVEHGVQHIVDAYRGEPGRVLDNAIDQLYPGLATSVKHKFMAWTPGYVHDTFVTCLSEHDASEDEYGRLSMWRAYGGDTGVALIFNGGVLIRPSAALAAYSSPVAYFRAGDVADQMTLLAKNLLARRPSVMGLGRDGLEEVLLRILQFGSVCIKHPAFKEEREWRVVASPSVEASEILKPELEVIGSIPQMVLKIRLEDRPDEGLTGLVPRALLDRVLIGPCEHSSVIRRALCSAMQDAGIEAVEHKLTVTDIPLRANQR